MSGLGGRRASVGWAWCSRLTVVAATVLFCGAGVDTLALPAQAHAARILKVHDEGHLKLVSGEGSTLIGQGSLSGTLPGSVRLRFSYSGGATVAAHLAVSGAGWTIRADSRMGLSNAASATPSFRGTLRITGGTGRFAHCSGSGELFGVFYRRSYGLTVQALGKLSY